MKRLFVFFVLCASAFAAYLYPTEFGCNYHIKISSKKYMRSGEYYGVALSSLPKFAKIIYSDSSYDILRCDDRDNYGHCYVKSVTSQGCSESYKSSYGYKLPYEFWGFDYDESKYPQPAECPDGSSANCTTYCTDNEECYILDEKLRVVQTETGDNITYYDDPFSMDVFALDKCKEPQTHLGPPANLCETEKEFHVDEPECSYHVKLESSGYSTYGGEYYGMLVNGDAQYLKKVQKGSATVVRCDDQDEDGKCYVRVVGSNPCSGSYQYPYSFEPNWVDSFFYDSAHYPRKVSCPDKSDGCLLYCEDETENECNTLDAKGRVVRDYLDYNWTYYDPPSVDDFDADKCDGTQFPKATDYCSVLETLNPKYPDCKFHMKGEKDHLTRNLYALIVNGTVLAFRSLYNNSEDILYRCDIDAHPNQCLEKYHLPVCQEQYYFTGSAQDYIHFMMHRSMAFNKSAYPEVDKCPDGTEGCKRYCELLGKNCVLVNSAGYFVKDGKDMVWTYTNDVSMDVFETDSCDSKSHTPAPADVCAGESSSSAAHSSNPTSASASSSTLVSASVSSASVIKSVFAVVAAAVVVALL